jgi:hypothetical protein
VGPVMAPGADPSVVDRSREGLCALGFRGKEKEK